MSIYKISIIVFCENPKQIKTVVSSLLKNTEGINYELIVLTQQAINKTNRFLKKASKRIPVIIEQYNTKDTIVKSYNKGVFLAKGSHVVLLEGSTYVCKNWLKNLISLIGDKIGFIGGNILFSKETSYLFWKNTEKNKIQNSFIYSKGIVFEDCLTYINALNIDYEQKYVKRFQNKNETRIALSSKCLLIDKQKYTDLSGLDENFNYQESILDMCLKLNSKGYENTYCAQAKILYKDHIQSEVKPQLRFQKTWFNHIKKKYWSEKLFSKPLLYSAENMTIAIAVTDYGENVTAGDYFTAKELALSITRQGWSVVFLSRIKGEWYNIPESVDVLLNLLDEYDLYKIPNRRKKLIKVAWARNWFDKWCLSHWFESYDLVFASSQISCDYIKANSGKTAILLPLATNPNRFEKNILPQGKIESFKSDFCFTGSYWGHSRDIMASISEKLLNKYAFHIYGANWEHIENMKKYSKGFIDYKKIPLVYQNTKIVIDDANHVTKPYGSVNSRVFDAIISGALVVTNGKKGSQELFSNKLPNYSTSAELEELIEYYLKNDEARKKKINELQNIVKKTHTYAHRAKTLIDRINTYIQKPSIAIKIPAPSWQEAPSWGDFHMAVSLKKQFEKQGFRVVLQILTEWDNEEGLACDVVLVLRGLSKYKLKTHQINLMWNISHPDKISYQEYQQYDKVFIASKYWTNIIAEKIPTPVECMYQCTDIDRFFPPNDKEIKANKKQLLFVGNSRNIYRKILKDLLPTSLKLSVFGKNWEGLISNHYIKGNYINNEELYLHYGSADVLLNDHWDDMREKGFISNRVYDGLACGALIISDKVKYLGGLKAYITTYQDSKELHLCINKFLNNLETRKEISTKGIKYIKNNHTFHHRVIQIINSIKVLS